MNKKKRDVKELGQEIDILDHMLSALADVLEEKGILTQEEWEGKMKSKVNRKSKSYREIQF